MVTRTTGAPSAPIVPTDAPDKSVGTEATASKTIKGVEASAKVGTSRAAGRSDNSAFTDASSSEVSAADVKAGESKVRPKKNKSQKKTASASSTDFASSFKLTNPTTKKLFSTRAPLKKGDVNGSQNQKVREIEYGDSPFDKGVINEIHSFSGDVAFEVTKKTHITSNDTRTTKAETKYFAKRIAQTSIKALEFTTRSEKAKDAQHHYALTEVTAGLAYQRFFSPSFTPKSRLISYNDGPELMIGSKIIPGLKTLEDVQESLSIEPYDPFGTDEANQSRGSCVEIDRSGLAKFIDESGAVYQGKAIQGLGDYAAATWFLGERDTNAGNIAFVPDASDQDKLQIIKLDHGYSLFFEEDPGTITRTDENGENPVEVKVSAEEFLTTTNLAKRLEDIGGNFPASSAPFKEFENQIRRLASLTPETLQECIDDVCNVYPEEHAKDNNFLKNDMLARLSERVNFAQQAIDHFDSRSYSPT